MDNNTHDLYNVVFKDYPDVMDVKQVSQLLGVSTKTVYGLIRKGSLLGVKVGREFRIPKMPLMKYMKIFGSSAAAQPT
jgi:excisionase family DNA binding protein